MERTWTSCEVLSAPTLSSPAATSRKRSRASITPSLRRMSRCLDSCQAGDFSGRAADSTSLCCALLTTTAVDHKKSMPTRREALSCKASKSPNRNSILRQLGVVHRLEVGGGGYPRPCRSFSNTTTQMLSLCSRETKSAPSRMRFGMVMRPKMATVETMMA